MKTTKKEQLKALPAYQQIIDACTQRLGSVEVVENVIDSYVFRGSVNNFQICAHITLSFNDDECGEGEYPTVLVEVFDLRTYPTIAVNATIYGFHLDEPNIISKALNHCVELAVNNPFPI